LFLPCVTLLTLRLDSFAAFTAFIETKTGHRPVIFFGSWILDYSEI
jgi:hypothetical protein